MQKPKKEADPLRRPLTENLAKWQKMAVKMG
jgi:hypothetical protein